jgi:hypothetical protein
LRTLAGVVGCAMRHLFISHARHGSRATAPSAPPSCLPPSTDEPPPPPLALDDPAMPEPAEPPEVMAASCVLPVPALPEAPALDEEPPAPVGNTLPSAPEPYVAEVLPMSPPQPTATADTKRQSAARRIELFWVGLTMNSHVVVAPPGKPTTLHGVACPCQSTSRSPDTTSPHTRRLRFPKCRRARAKFTNCPDR